MTTDSARPDPARRPVHVFVARRGNRFMRDIATWIVDAAIESGHTATLIDDRLPRPDGSINLVVAPHEFYPLRDDDDAAIRAAAACSVPICTEQPGTPWFHLALGFCIGSPLVVDINAVGLDAIDRAGFDVHRLRLGGVPTLDRWTHAVGTDCAPERDIDVVFLGGYTDRRAAALAQLGPVLWERHSEIRLFTFSRPIRGNEPGVVFGTQKYDLLARSKVLVNLHRDDGDDGYFEWARMVETMANGCVVVTEPSIGHDPLVAGTHFVEVIDDLATEVISLLDDEDRRTEIAAAAYRAVMEEQPLAGELSRLLERIEHLLDHEGCTSLDWRCRVARYRAAHRPVQRDHKPPLLPVFAPLRPTRRAIYDQLMAEISHRRELGRLRSLVERGDPDHVEEYTTPAWDVAQAGAGDAAEVGVVVTLYGYADVVIETLDSIVASRDVGLEIVIVDDHSVDDGVAVVRRWMGVHPETAVLLLACAANRGLPHARNLGIGRVRAGNVMMMDADNQVYPTCLRRLCDALNDDPSASFAYATLEAFGPLPGLRSSQGWHVPWLCEKNYIDAQAMIRRSTLERHGGYLVGESMYGWEDWELWLRLADAGEHGVHVPEMLGRYRTQLTSMIALTNLAADDLLADLVARYPNLPWPT
jgi:Glycosyl transferase family 2/Glycosyl transferases group 1